MIVDVQWLIVDSSLVTLYQQPDWLKWQSVAEWFYRLVKIRLLLLGYPLSLEDERLR